MRYKYLPSQHKTILYYANIKSSSCPDNLLGEFDGSQLVSDARAGNVPI